MKHIVKEIWESCKQKSETKWTSWKQHKQIMTNINTWKSRSQYCDANVWCYDFALLRPDIYVKTLLSQLGKHDVSCMSN